MISKVQHKTDVLLKLISSENKEPKQRGAFIKKGKEKKQILFRVEERLLKSCSAKVGASKSH